MTENPNHINIRAFQPSDIDELIALFRLSVRKGAANDYTHEQRLAWAPDEIDRDEWLKNRLRHPTWLATIDDNIAGFIDLEADGHIDMLYVHPNFHRRGIARSLMRVINDHARKHHIPRLFTEASITARPAFETFGFKTTQQQTVHRNGQEFTNFRMEKLL